MAPPPDLDPKAIQRQFGRRVARLPRADFLLREVERRMLERLDVVRLAPTMVLDVGTGLGQGAAALQQRYPAARVLGVDLATPLVQQALRLHGAAARSGLAGRLRRWFGAELGPGAHVPAYLAADAARLPLAASSVDLLWSNLAWHWFVDPKAVLAEWYRTLRPDGLLMFSAFGVDTLRELRGIGAATPAFPDMHDIGDALGVAGFADPVMDSERLSVSWSDPQILLDEVAALGGNAMSQRSSGLQGRAARARWLSAIDGLRGADGRISLSLELVYGHAWCPPQKRRADGYVPIGFVGRRGPAASP